MRLVSFIFFYGEILMYKYLLSLMVLLPLSTFAVAQEAEEAENQKLKK